MLVAVAVGALGNVVGTAIVGSGHHLEHRASPSFGLIVLANVLGMMTGFMLGVLIRNSAGAIVGYFVMTLVLPGIGEALRNTSEWFSANQPWIDFNIATGRLFEGADGLTTEAWAQAGFTTLVWVLIPLAIGMRFLLRSEIK